MVLRNPDLQELEEVDWGKPATIESDVRERYGGTIEITAGVTFDDSVSHTFTKTRTLLETAKVGAELAVKAYAEVYGEAGMEGMKAGGKAGLEVSAKITGEYQRQWGGGETESNTVSRHINVVGPAKLQYEAVRSLDKQQRQMTGQVNFSHTVELLDETGAGERPPKTQVVWPSLLEFLAVARGIAPMDRAMAREFHASPISEAKRDEIAEPSAEEVSWLVDYDNVRNQDIKVV